MAGPYDEEEYQQDRDQSQEHEREEQEQQQKQIHITLPELYTIVRDEFTTYFASIDLQRRVCLTELWKRAVQFIYIFFSWHAGAASARDEQVDLNVPLSAPEEDEEEAEGFGGLSGQHQHYQQYGVYSPRGTTAQNPHVATPSAGGKWGSPFHG